MGQLNRLINNYLWKKLSDAKPLDPVVNVKYVIEIWRFGARDQRPQNQQNPLAFRGFLLRKALLHMPRWILQSARLSVANRLIATNCYHSTPASCGSQISEYIPVRKQLKDEAKAERIGRLEELTRHSTPSPEKVLKWELTVGIEIHAQLNTARKLFSSRSF